VVAATARPGPTCPWEAARATPTRLFPLFYQVEIRHRQLLQSHLRTRSGVPTPATVQYEFVNYMIVYY
jgi:hypothetical protein